MFIYLSVLIFSPEIIQFNNIIEIYLNLPFSIRFSSQWDFGKKIHSWPAVSLMDISGLEHKNLVSEVSNAITFRFLLWWAVAWGNTWSQSSIFYGEAKPWWNVVDMRLSLKGSDLVFKWNSSIDPNEIWPPNYDLDLVDFNCSTTVHK